MSKYYDNNGGVVMPGNKLMTLQEALTMVEDGMQVGLGGGPLSMNPVGLAAGLLARGSRNLALVVAPIGGFAADLLIAGGAAASVEFAQLGFEELGMAPAFRQAAQNGAIAVLDHT
jgi:glutaconate CoA-transferase, subunit A